MSYSDFTFDTLQEKFNVQLIEHTTLFPNPQLSPVPARLAELLEHYVPLATMMNTEKARSELMIAPVLVELKLNSKRPLSLFSGVEFVVDQKEGLNGRCDYIISQSEEQLVLRAPIIVVVEAKNENIIGGIPQCIAEMIAAIRFNIQKGNPIETVYGIVTTGSLWRFIKMNCDYRVMVDSVEYPIQHIDTILGILHAIIA